MNFEKPMENKKLEIEEKERAFPEETVKKLGLGEGLNEETEITINPEGGFTAVSGDKNWEVQSATIKKKLQEVVKIPSVEKAKEEKLPPVETVSPVFQEMAAQKAREIKEKGVDVGFVGISDKIFKETEKLKGKGVKKSEETLDVEDVLMTEEEQKKAGPADYSGIKITKDF